MNKKAVFVLLTVVALGFPGVAGAANLPEGTVGNGSTPPKETSNTESGFELFVNSFESSDSEVASVSANMPEPQVGSGAGGT